jgi:hypothetical protein
MLNGEWSLKNFSDIENTFFYTKTGRNEKLIMQHSGLFMGCRFSEIGIVHSKKIDLFSEKKTFSIFRNDNIWIKI